MLLLLFGDDRPNVQLSIQHRILMIASKHAAQAKALPCEGASALGQMLEDVLLHGMLQCVNEL